MNDDDEKFDLLTEDSDKVKKLKSFNLAMYILSFLIVIIAFFFNFIIGIFAVVIAVSFIRISFGFDKKTDRFSKRSGTVEEIEEAE